MWKCTCKHFKTSAVDYNQFVCVCVCVSVERHIFFHRTEGGVTAYAICLRSYKCKLPNNSNGWNGFRLETKSTPHCAPRRLASNANRHIFFCFVLVACFSSSNAESVERKIVGLAAFLYLWTESIVIWHNYHYIGNAPHLPYTLLFTILYSYYLNMCGAPYVTISTQFKVHQK